MRFFFLFIFFLALDITYVRRSERFLSFILVFFFLFSFRFALFFSPFLALRSLGQSQSSVYGIDFSSLNSFSSCSSYCLVLYSTRIGALHHLVLQDIHTSVQALVLVSCYSLHNTSSHCIIHQIYRLRPFAEPQKINVSQRTPRPILINATHINRQKRSIGLGGA